MPLCKWIQKKEDEHEEFCSWNPGGANDYYFGDLFPTLWELTAPHKYSTIES